MQVKQQQEEELTGRVQDGLRENTYDHGEEKYGRPSTDGLWTGLTTVAFQELEARHSFFAHCARSPTPTPTPTNDAYDANDSTA